MYFISLSVLVLDVDVAGNIHSYATRHPQRHHSLCSCPASPHVQSVWQLPSQQHRDITLPDDRRKPACGKHSRRGSKVRPSSVRHPQPPSLWDACQSPTHHNSTRWTHRLRCHQILLSRFSLSLPWRLGFMTSFTHTNIASSVDESR